MRLLPPKFNRLTVFDPRIPHGVREVRGTKDPRYGRLVVHGWFVQPQPFVEGPLDAQMLEEHLGPLMHRAGQYVSAGLDVAGLLSMRLQVAASGHVTDVVGLADTTRAPGEQERERGRMVRTLLTEAKTLRFPPKKKPSRITLPLVFEPPQP